MSRVIPIALAANMTSAAPTVAWCIRITRLDSTEFLFTSHDQGLTVAGDDYAAAPGLDVLSLAHSAGLAVDNTEITVLADDAIITRDEIAAGRWDGAAFEIFQTNWKNTSDGVLVRMAGRFGNFTPRGVAFVAELRDLRQGLQQDNTPVLQPTCRYRLGDAKCTVDLGPFTESVTVTSVASQSQFTDTARTEAAAWFTEGEVVWLTGDNAGLRQKIRSFSGGVFQLAAPMIYAIQVGDTADAIAGCTKRHLEDCRDKFDNVLNFGGEPDKPTVDSLIAPAEFD